MERQINQKTWDGKDIYIGIDVHKKNWKVTIMSDQNEHKKTILLVEKAYKLIQEQRMRDIDKKLLEKKMNQALKDEKFNMYMFIKDWLN